MDNPTTAALNAARNLSAAWCIHVGTSVSMSGAWAFSIDVNGGSVVEIGNDVDAVRQLHDRMVASGWPSVWNTTVDPARLCDRCGNPYTSVGRAGHTIVDNALGVTFTGGYDWFYDPDGALGHQTVLCHECAHELCDWLNIPRTDVVGWHSHTDDYRAEHPDHFGWDYPKETAIDVAEPGPT